MCVLQKEGKDLMRERRDLRRDLGRGIMMGRKRIAMELKGMVVRLRRKTTQRKTTITRKKASFAWQTSKDNSGKTRTVPS